MLLTLHNEHVFLSPERENWFHCGAPIVCVHVANKPVID